MKRETRKKLCAKCKAIINKADKIYQIEYRKRKKVVVRSNNK